MTSWSLLYFFVCVPQAFVEPREYSVNVIGGLDAGSNTYPYQVSIQKFNQHFCGGSIISQKWVLTAGHCVLKQPNKDKVVSAKNFLVVAGIKNLKANGTAYRVEKVVPRPHYSNVNDIALLKIAKTIKFTKLVQPIELASTYPPVGEVAIVTGWGTNSADPKNKTKPDQLQVLSVKILPLEDCTKKGLREDKTYLIVNPLICTMNPRGQGICRGDSGGPLVSTKNQQIGIVSSNYGLCASNNIDLYISVSSFRQWIKDHTGV